MGGEREIGFPLLIHFPNDYSDTLGQVKASSLELLLSLPCGWKDPSTLASSRYLPKYISRDLEWKQGNWDLNVYS